MLSEAQIAGDQANQSESSTLTTFVDVGAASSSAAEASTSALTAQPAPASDTVETESTDESIDEEEESDDGERDVDGFVDNATLDEGMFYAWGNNTKKCDTAALLLYHAVSVYRTMASEESASSSR